MLRVRSLGGVVSAAVVSGVLVSSTAWAAPFAYIAATGVSVVDLAKNQEVKSITTGGDPYWVNISADGSVVAASLHNSTGVAIINGKTNTLLGVVNGVGSEPEAVAVNSDGSKVYVADESGDNLYEVTVSSLSITAGPIDLSGCSEPENMVITPDDTFLYITCAGSSVIRVATSGFAITSIATGLGDPHGIALNRSASRLYYSLGANAAEYNTGAASDTGTTYAGCELYGGAVSPNGNTLYCGEESSSLLIHRISDGTLLKTVALGSCCSAAVGVHPNGNRVYVPTSAGLKVIDASSMTVINTIPTTGGGRGIAVGLLTARAPALNQWALLALAALLGIAAFLAMRRRGLAS